MPNTAIGIDLGASNLRVCYGNEKEVKGRVTQKVRRGDHPRILIEQIIEMINSLKADFSTIGIGSVGPLDIRKGRVLMTANLPYQNFDLTKPLEKEFGVPAFVVNDCDAGVIAEKFFGHGKNSSHLAYVTLSTGIGCGVISNGKLVLGKDGNATEMGHVAISSEGSMKCGCGGIGHWEAYCSGRNIPNYARYLIGNNSGFKKSMLSSLAKGSLDSITSEMVFEAAKKKDTLAQTILEKIGIMNSIGVSAVNNAYDVDLIVIGGSVAINNREMILEPIRSFVPRLSYNRAPRVEVTNLGDDIVPMGALALAFNYDKLIEF